MTKILIIGHSGTGKSRSIKTLNPDETTIINVANKPLPFKSSGYTILNISNPDEILEAFETINTPNLIIDDAQYVMAFQFMNRAKERGFDKFVEIGQTMFQIVQYPFRNEFVAFLWHAEDVAVNGGTFTKAKTIGRMLDEKITLEGLFTIVLQSVILKNAKNVEYVFQTNSTGDSIAKSPEGMFPLYIPNDLALVRKTINEYYNLNERSK